MSTSGIDLLKQLKDSRWDDWNFDHVYNKLEEKINNYIKEIEVKNKTAKPHDERFLEIQFVDSSSHKLTVNLCEGRFTLKVSNRASQKVGEDLTNMTIELMKTMPNYLTTLRGKIGWLSSQSKYIWIGQSESKHFSYKFEYSPIGD